MHNNRRHSIYMYKKKFELNFRGENWKLNGKNEQMTGVGVGGVWIFVDNPSGHDRRIKMYEKKIRVGKLQ